MGTHISPKWPPLPGDMSSTIILSIGPVLIFLVSAHVLNGEDCSKSSLIDEGKRLNQATRLHWVDLTEPLWNYQNGSI